jgi:hypothetical protein
MLEGLAIGLLALSTGLFLLAPLFTVADPTPEALGEQERAELATRQASVLATLQDLDFDLATHKISEADHRDLKERYTEEAVALMRKMDAAVARRPH